MIREVVSSTILFELRDPRIRNVTVLGADVSPDLRYASVRVSVMGDEKTAALTMHGLDSARGFLQSKIGEFIKSRYTPEIRFVLDDGVKKSAETAALLREALSSDPEALTEESESEQDADDLPETADAFANESKEGQIQEEPRGN
jgi:ribosome-binding factor A